MRNSLFVFIAILILSCSTEQPTKREFKTEVDEVVDIRIYSDGEIRFNGSIISGSSLPGHIESLNTTESTRARVILDENAPTGLVNKTQHLLYEEKITRTNFHMLSSEEFKNYNQSKIHIDVLSSGEILFEGNQLYPKDLKIGLKNIEITPSTKFIVSVSQQAQVGPVFVTLEELAARDMTKIIYEDLSKYHH